MKVEKFHGEYKLEPASVDEIAERIESFLISLKTERANMIRIRLAMEEALLRWMDHFGSDVMVALDLGISVRRPAIRMSLRGEPYDPLTNSDSDLGYWADSLTKSIGLKPIYSYIGDENVITLKLTKPSADPAKRLVISILTGLIIGAATFYTIPNSILETVTDSFLQPVQEMFFRLLNIAAIPIIFLSVLSAVCGAGTVADKGKSNRKMLKHFVFLSAVISLVGVAVAVRAYGISHEYTVTLPAVVSYLIDTIMSLVPTDIMTPFQSGNSPQLIFLSFILGNALLVAGHQAEHLIRIVDESHRVILLIADWVSGLTPFFVVVLLIMGIWNGYLMKVVSLWLPIAVFTIVTYAILGIWIFLLSNAKKVGISNIIRKIKGPFWTAFWSSSVKDAYSENFNCCVNKLGISKHLANYSVPLGLVLFQPAATMGLVIFSLYAATLYNVDTPFFWVISTVVLAVILQTASPPVSGVNLLAYAAIFSRMGIPTDALILAMVADTFFCFLSSAADQTMLEFELVFEADTTGQLDKDILTKE